MTTGRINQVARDAQGQQCATESHIHVPTRPAFDTQPTRQPRVLPLRPARRPSELAGGAVLQTTNTQRANADRAQYTSERLD